MTLIKVKKRLSSEEYIYSSEKVINGFILYIAFKGKKKNSNDIYKIYFKTKKEINQFLKGI